MAELDKIVEKLSELTVIEASELASMLEKKWGITATSLPSSPSSTKASNEEIVAKPEKSQFNVLLKSVGQNKISVIKAIKEITGLGLKESRDMVSSAPTTIKEDVAKNTAEEISKKLTDVGATVELK